MAMQVWQKAGDATGAVLALTDDVLYRFEFTGKTARQETGETAAALHQGADPAAMVVGDRKRLPLTAIERVEVTFDRETVKFHAREDGRPVVVAFPSTREESTEIARAVVDRAGMKHAERSEDVGVVEALTGPAILAVILGVLWGVLYLFVSADEEVDPLKLAGRSKGRMFKRVFVFIANLLGMKGTIAVGAILLVLFLAWFAMRIVKRPQRLVWGPEGS